MRGAEMRLQREMETVTFAAWQIARMTYYGDKRLKPLGEYLKQLKGTKRQTPEEMLAMLKDIFRGIKDQEPKVDHANKI